MYFSTIPQIFYIKFSNFDNLHAHIHTTAHLQHDIVWSATIAAPAIRLARQAHFSIDSTQILTSAHTISALFNLWQLLLQQWCHSAKKKVHSHTHIRAAALLWNCRTHRHTDTIFIFYFIFYFFPNIVIVIVVLLHLLPLAAMQLLSLW